MGGHWREAADYWAYLKKKTPSHSHTHTHTLSLSLSDQGEAWVGDVMEGVEVEGDGEVGHHEQEEEGDQEVPEGEKTVCV